MWLYSRTVNANTLQLFEDLHNSTGFATSQSTENTEFASVHCTKLYQAVRETGPNPFISFLPPAMKLQRESLGAFCCLAAKMCNFWKCSSRIKRPGLTTPIWSSPRFVVPDSPSQEVLSSDKIKTPHSEMSLPITFKHSQLRGEGGE